MKKPTVDEVLHKQEAVFTVTVLPEKLFRNWKTYKIRLAIAMLFIRIASWISAIPYEVKEETTMKFDIDDCGVCHEKHTGLEMHELKDLIYEEGVVWTHFVICPVMNKQVMVRIDDKKEKTYDRHSKRIS